MIDPRMLGVVLAGGGSRRFGSDKALAEIDGRTLIAHAVEALALWCGQVVVAGRETAPAPAIADWPGAGLGPLGGIAAGLRHARDKGFASILTCGVDSWDLPRNLGTVLHPAPAFVETQPVIGHWPVNALETAEAMLRGEGPHSMYAFTRATGARPVPLAEAPMNINSPADLEAVRRMLSD